MIVVKSLLFACYLNNETSVFKAEVICCYKTKEIVLRSKRFNKHRKINIPVAICKAVPASCVCFVKRRSVFAKCVTMDFIMKTSYDGKCDMFTENTELTICAHYIAFKNATKILLLTLIDQENQQWSERDISQFNCNNFKFFFSPWCNR